MATTEFINTQRGGFTVCVNNFMFRQKRTFRSQQGVIMYYYCISGCSSSVQVHNNKIMLDTLIEKHLHPNHEADIKRLRIERNIRKRAAEEPLTSMHAIYSEELQKVSSAEGIEAAASVSSFRTMCSSLYRDRSKRFAGLPKRLSDLRISGKWMSTMNGKDFLLADDGFEDKILIFGTIEFLKIACQASRLVADGTFKVVPSQFAQLYIFHAKYFGQNFALLYCFLPSKRKPCYIRMLELLKSVATKNGFSLNPKSYNIDFEASAVKALKHSQPESEVKGCLFHFGQCVWRKVQELGLASLYNSDKHVQGWVRLAISLALVPPGDIHDAYMIVDQNCPSVITPTQATHFLDYLVQTWVDDLDSKFPRSMWNHFDNQGARTTNAAESFHSKLNRAAKKAHLNIFEIIEVLQKIQNAAEIDIARLKAGAPPKLPPLKTRKIEQRIVRLKAMLIQKQISLEDYMRSVSTTFHVE